MKKLLLLIAISGGFYWFHHHREPLDGMGGDVAAADANTPAPPPRPVLGQALQISAYVDGESKLIVTKESLQWAHTSGAKPGILVPVNSKQPTRRVPIVVNGQKWVPRWMNESPTAADVSTVFPVRLASLSYKLETLVARGPVRFSEQTDSLTITFSDPPQGGDIYTFRLVPQPAKAEEVIEFQARQPRFSSDGIFYLTTRISVPTDSGASAVEPGTPVKTVGDADGKLRVTDGAIEFEVSRNQLTNDVDAAHFLAVSAQEARAGGGVMAKEQTAETERLELARRKQAEQERQNYQQPTVAAALPPLGSGWDNPLNRGAYNQTETFKSGRSATANIDSAKEADKFRENAQRQVVENKRREEAAKNAELLRAERKVNEGAIQRLEEERRNTRSGQERSKLTSEIAERERLLKKQRYGE